eukprot:gene1637-1815_t
MDNDKNNSNNVFHGNFRSVAGRPDLGLSTQSQHFAPLRDQEENLSNLNNEQEEPVVTGMPFSILSPMDGLPAYSMFPTLPKLGRRKRPKIRKRIAQGEGGGSRTELAIGANAEQLIGIVDLATALGREEFEVASEGMDMDTDNDIEDSQDGGDSLECVDNAIMIPQDFPTILDLPFSKKSLACVRPQSGTYGVVGVDRKGFRCLTCSHGRHSCPHVTCIKFELERDSENVPEFLYELVEEHSSLKALIRRPYVRHAISKNQIPAQVVQTQKSIFNGHLNSSVEEITTGDNKVLRLIPDDDKFCFCSHEFAVVKWSEDKKNLFTLKNILEDRIFINDSATRKSFRSLAKTREIDPEERLKLNQLLQSKHPSLFRVLSECEELYTGIAHVPDSVWVLFQCLSSSSPVVSYFPLSDTLDKLMSDLANGLIIRKEPKRLLDLQTIAPIIFGVLKGLPSSRLSKNWLDLFSSLRVTSKACFSNEQHNLGLPTESNCELSHPSFFPAWPALCDRGFYEMDCSRTNARERCNKL